MDQFALQHSQMKDMTPHKRNFMKDCYSLLAKCKQNLGDWHGAVNDLKELCKLDEDDSNSVLQLALALRECNEVDEAIRILRRLSIIENNNNPFTLYQLANMLAINEKLDQSITYHLRAIQKIDIQKGDEEKELLFKTYHNLAITYKRVDEKENADTYGTKCEELLQSTPGLMERVNEGQIEFGGEGIDDITEYEKEQELKHTTVEPVDITKKRFRIEEVIGALSGDVSINNQFKLIQDALKQDEKEGKIRDITEEEMDTALNNMSPGDMKKFDHIFEKLLADGAIAPIEKEGPISTKLKTKSNSNSE
jgi:tetratricopeptide (TPR) repeat protein